MKQKVFKPHCKYLNLSRYCDHKCVDFNKKKVICSREVCPFEMVTKEPKDLNSS